MKKVILIKYGELTTKKNNRLFFIKILEKNIREHLKSFDYEIVKDYYRMFIYTKEENIDIFVEALSKIFGIYEIIIAYEINDKSLDSINNKALEIISQTKFKTFKVQTNRSDKEYPISSMDLSAKVGGFILRNKKEVKVDVHTPETILNIEIRREYAYIFASGIKGLGGYPVGSLGKGLLMLSGGIDSPVAGYLTMKRGVVLDYVYFESIPHTSIEARNKVISLAKTINSYNSKSKLYIINFTKIQEAIYRNLKEDYLITIMRRMMYRISERLAKRVKALAIVNGESIGQVASQTLSSMNVVNEVTNFPVLRPLSSFDKLEIINISKKINTYETSILPYEDCCTVFVPKHPVINPNLNVAKEFEEKIDFEKFITSALDAVEVISFEEIEEHNEYL